MSTHNRAVWRATALAAAMLFAAQPVQAHEFKADGIEIVHPWSRETPEAARVAAGYVTLRNTGSQPDRLVGVSGEIAGRTEIHEMAVNEQGVMTMRPVAGGVDIPAGGTVELKPGSYHIMFMELERRPRQGESFAGTLTFEKGGTVEVQFSVGAMGSGAGHGSHGGHGD